MSTKWLKFAPLPLAVAVGALATVDSALPALVAILAIPIVIFLAKSAANKLSISAHLEPDWILVLLPTALSIRSFSGTTALIITGMLGAAAFLRKPNSKFLIYPGPLILLFAATVIVYSRTPHMGMLLTFLIVGALIFQLITTVDSRRLIVSLIDGCGLYLVANVIGHIAGLYSPRAINRIGGLALADGSTRTIFPFSSALNTPPIIASIYATVAVFLIFGSGGWTSRILRLICLAAALTVLVGAASRQPMITATILSVALVFFPYITRWLAQAATLLAAFSAVVLPGLIASAAFLLTPLASTLASRRVNEIGSIESLNSRNYIWHNSVQYWLHDIYGLPHALLGFGVEGQYKSGASSTYSDRLSSVVQNPELASVHNSFLQQLFDGGLLGWLLLLIAVYWAAVRLGGRRQDWGTPALMAVGAFAALLVSGMTEASYAPGKAQETFWLLIVLVGISCQGKQTAIRNNAHPNMICRGAEKTVSH